MTRETHGGQHGGADPRYLARAIAQRLAALRPHRAMSQARHMDFEDICEAVASVFFEKTIDFDPVEFIEHCKHGPKERKPNVKVK